MSVKKTIIMGLVAMGVGVPMLAQAAMDLYITNNTKNDSTIIANTGACSTLLGEAGITRSGEQNHQVPENKVGLACSASILKKTDCKADVYMTSNCTGPVVATVYFDIQKDKSGKYVGSGLRPVKPEDIKDKSYTVIGSGLNVIINGGPAVAAK